MLWTYGGRVMRRKAESVNFVPAARWDDQSVGTNALDLANRLRRPAMVFSAEHYAPIVHNWVCWAAPVHDPVTGAQLGVIDLSTTWDRTHPIGLATARVMARLIEQAMPLSRAHPGLEALEHPVVEGLALRLLGNAEAHLDGSRLLLNRRQTEILALLAINAEGISLERLHALVYGDQGVTLSTLKAEVSHLRSALGGQLTSRPYRLTMPVSTDVDVVLAAVRRGDVRGALAAYGGDLLPGTNSPALAELGEYVAVAVREALLADPRARGRGPLQRAGAVRRRGDRGLPGPAGRPAPPGQATPQGPPGRRRAPEGRIANNVLQRNHCKQAFGVLA